MKRWQISISKGRLVTIPPCSIHSPWITDITSLLIETGYNITHIVTKCFRFSWPYSQRLNSELRFTKELGRNQNQLFFLTLGCGRRFLDARRPF